MPHSSGGGSHRGGSHGGSFGGGHSHSSGSGNNTPRISRKPYPHAHRYMYHNRWGEERYVYCKEKPKKQSVASFIFALVFMLPFSLMGLGMLGPAGMVLKDAGFFGVQPLQPLSTCEEVHIADNAGVITNTAALEQSLQAFEDLTGICPFVETIYNSVWENESIDLEDYAYYLYEEKFADEQHFLLVYSEPENALELTYVDWYWEGMQGYDTDAILTERKFTSFQSDLQTSLESGDVSVGEAFEKTFTNSLEYIMERKASSIDWGRIVPYLFFALFWNGIIICMVVSVVRSFIDSRREYTEVESGVYHPSENSGNYDYGKYDESQFDYGKYGDPKDGYQ